MRRRRRPAIGRIVAHCRDLRLNMALAAGIFFVGIRALLSLSQDVAIANPVKKIAAQARC